MLLEKWEVELATEAAWRERPPWWPALSLRVCWWWGGRTWCPCRGQSEADAVVHGGRHCARMKSLLLFRIHGRSMGSKNRHSGSLWRSLGTKDMSTTRLQMTSPKNSQNLRGMRCLLGKQINYYSSNYLTNIELKLMRILTTLYLYRKSLMLRKLCMGLHSPEGPQ